MNLEEKLTWWRMKLTNHRKNQLYSPAFYFQLLFIIPLIVKKEVIQNNYPGIKLNNP
jgi:hypothetical protein